VLDGEPCALEHLAAERLLVRSAARGDRYRGLDGTEEADLDALEVGGLGQLTAIAAELDGVEEETFVRVGEAAVGLVLGRRVAVGRFFLLLGLLAGQPGNDEEQEPKCD